jgi:hypothetical protein
MFMIDTTQTPVRISAAATIATITELLSTLFFFDLLPVPLPPPEQEISKGVPQSLELLRNAAAPKAWIFCIEGMGPERLLEETLKNFKLAKVPRENGMFPERLFCDKSRSLRFDRLPRVSGMPPSSWFLCKSRTSRDVKLSRVLGISPSNAFPETSLHKK